MKFPKQPPRTHRATIQIEDEGYIEPSSSYVETEVSDEIYGGVTATASSLPQHTISPKVGISALQATPEAYNTSWSSAVNTFLEQPPATLPLRMILGGAIFCVVLGAWAWFGKIEDVGKAQGKLVPKGETYKIQPIDLGKVNRISVKEGDSVKQGQLLVELDTELATKEVERLQQTLIADQIQLNQKQTLLERVALEAKTQQVIAAAEQKAQESAIALAREKSTTTNQLLQQQQSQAVIYENRQSNLQPLTKTAQERLKQLRSEKAAHEERIERLKPLLAEGAISQDVLFQAEQALRETEQRITSSQLQEVTNANEQIFQAQQALQDLEKNITQNQGDLTTASKEVEQLQAELTQKQAQAQVVQITANQRMQQLKGEISELDAKIAETKTLIKAAQTKLKYKYLRAPVDGVVLALNSKNTGEVIQSGQTVAEIAPYGVPLVLSAVLPNEEAGFIKEGMKAQVKFDAYPYQDYGVITGEVTDVSSDAKSDRRLGTIYLVEITLNKDHVTQNQQVITFKPGQTATAEIIIRRRRIADVILEPFKKLQQDGMQL